MAGIKGAGCKSWDYYLDLFNKIHGDKYDYIKPDGENSYGRGKISIICQHHGIFVQRLQDHRRGSMCPKCALRKPHKSSLEKFIKESHNIHNGKYEYDLDSFTGVREKIKIKCPEHGWFKSIAYDHKKGHGCPGCKASKHSSRITKTFEEFVDDANAVHNNKYEYRGDTYINRQTPTTIVCKHHGDFELLPSDHIHSKIGCPSCARFVSLAEEQWLNSIGLPDDNKHRQVWITTRSGKRIRVDGYNKSSKTVYLFHGDYWHGNPKVFNKNNVNKHTQKTFGELYEDTIKYEEDILDSGYELVIMWERDFKN